MSRPWGGGRSGRQRAGDAGTSLVELLMVVVCLALLAGMSAPAVTRAMDAARARHAAGFLAARLRDARHQAVSRTRSVGLAFDPTTRGGWRLRACQDGNANGLRRSDIAAGTDTCHDDLSFTEAFPRVALAIEPGLRGPDGRPAGTDPVRFGQSDLASCSPAGTCTPGTCYIRSEGGAQYAVRLAGATGRLRILRYDAGSGRWVAG